MKTSLIIKDELLREAMAVTKVREKTAVIHLGLEELIKKAARERLVALGGRMRDAKAPRRRKAR